MTDDETIEDEPLDPRIQEELEKLNKASLLINKLENDLDEARGQFRVLLTESTQSLDVLSKKLGNCIDRAKPYYDARLKAKEVQILAHTAATKYERAISMQSAAREMVELAEQGYETKKPKFDTAWQEMLNHATIKVMDAEQERLIRETEHKKTAQQYSEVQDQVNNEYKLHKKSIAKSKSYYEMKGTFHNSLEHQKGVIDRLQKDINSAKKLYEMALRNLETISEEIHAQRKARESLGERSAGVGSETPTPAPDESANPAKVTSQTTEDDNSHRQSLNSQSNDNDSPPFPVIDSVSPTESNDIEKSRSASPDNSLQAPDICVTDNADGMEASKTRSISFADSTTSNESISPVVLRRHGSLSAPYLSARKLLEEACDSSNSDTGSVNSVVLDDDVLGGALSEKIFDGSYEHIIDECAEDRIGKQDYNVLPEKLSKYQHNFENARKSVASLNDVELKLDQVLKLIDEAGDESYV